VKVFRTFAAGSALLAFVLAVLGSWVRINNAGLTCPDWPLCHGQLVPALHGGIVLEWSHRLVAFVETFFVLGAIVTGLRERKAVAGVAPALVALALIFALQVSLGGITVLLANSPLSVMLHWGMGMALLADLTILAVLAWRKPQPTARERATRASGFPVAGILALTATLAFVTMCAGAYVSSSYAGLACTLVPGCGDTAFGQTAAQHVQMLHRVLAAGVALAALVAAVIAKDASFAVRSFAWTGAALVAAQIALGIGNVVWRLPIGLREAHAANAGATFLAFVIATVLAALEPLPGGAAQVAPAESTARAAGRRVAPTA
jgi:cytochrome c oxidase assembly protein subunit 15